MVGSSGVLLGEAACLGAAALWAVAVAVFRPAIETYGARAVNLVKCSLATVLLGGTTWIAGQTGELASAPAAHLWLIAVSGLIGLTLGDTALFASVARIGTHRTLLLQTLAPIFTAVIAAVWQREVPTPGQAAGAVLILLGVGVVVAPGRNGDGSSTGASRTLLAAGVGFGVLAAFGQGAGVVLAKEGMTEIPFLPASFLRLFAAAAGLVLLSAAGPSLRSAIRVVRSPRVLGRVVPATFIGTYVAILLMMVGIHLAPAAVAAVLLSMSPVFGLFVDRWAVGAPITARGVLGTLIAVAGVAVLTTL